MCEPTDAEIVAAAKALYGSGRVGPYFPLDLRWSRLSVKTKMEWLEMAYAALRAARKAKQEMKR